VTASPTAPPTHSPVPTVAGTIRPTTVPLPSSAEISAPTKDVVWIVVGGVVLFRSTDRGDTWQQRPLPPSSLRLDGISFVSDREGWVLYLGDPAPQCQTQPAALVEVWHTTDAGATYERLPVTGITDEGCKGRLSFVDAQRGFLVGSRTDTAPVIYRTVDGGRSWTASPPIAPPRITPGSADLDVGIVRALGPELLVEAFGTGQDRGHAIYRSADGGASWNVLTAVPALDPVGFVTERRWIRIAAPDQSFETTDAGATWHAFTTDYSQAAPVSPAVVFADDQVGYATVRGTIQRTVDGGAHWTSLSTPGT
jgi:photosystem II stability/assembly factor-like uncharacterized protein